MLLQGAKHATMTDNIHIALRKYHTANQKLNHIQLLTWLQETHNVKVIQDTFSNMLTRKAESTKLDIDANAKSM